MSKKPIVLKQEIKNTNLFFKKYIKNVVEFNTNNILKNYSIKSSWASYSSTGNKYSYSSINQLKSNLIIGVRFIHLNIYNEEGQPMVKGENEQSVDNPKGLIFDDCCKTIREYGFENENISSYPLFLYLELMYDSIRTDISNIIGESIKKHFGDKYPDIKYGYAKQNLALEKVDNFKNKIILLINYGNEEKPRFDGYCLQELTHGYIQTYNYLPKTPEDNHTIIALKSNDVNNTYNPIDFNLKKEVTNLNRLIILLPKDNNGAYKRFNGLHNFNILNFNKNTINFLPFKFIPVTIDNKLNTMKDIILKYVIFYNIGNFSTPVKLFNIS